MLSCFKSATLSWHKKTHVRNLCLSCTFILVGVVSCGSTESPDNRPPILHTTWTLKWGGGVYSASLNYTPPQTCGYGEIT